MTAITAARIELLTAEVRVLQVGSRQITLSVARQLDQVDPDDIEPFGRICTGRKPPYAAVEMIEVVGSTRGVLTRCTVTRQRRRCDDSYRESTRVGSEVGSFDAYISLCSDHPRCREDGPYRHRLYHYWIAEPDVWFEWSELPLIVLAGLR
jgi:hypothetical protein